MIPRIRSIEPLPDLILRVEFDDGRRVLYDVKEDVAQIPSYSVLLDVYELFPQVRLDRSRTCVYWNEDVDLASDAIYEYGREIPADGASPDADGASPGTDAEIDAGIDTEKEGVS